ncbi:MAG: N-acetylmuramoyl-L-alanine amidase, partial [Acetatifactor sp.]|nr:N-acetylmuramoyl-L-alanine amidase [Acetatifactor sp.]
VLALLAVLLAFAALPVEAASWPHPSDRNIVVVIDPGHGGNNEGTTENGFCEKEMTLTTAMALYERLSQYDGVTVYLTRTDDTDIILKKRAEFAQSVGADFLFSIHYNASENHELFGSEVWVPLTAPYNVYGYQFGNTLLMRLQEKGLFIRGIKTRKNDRGTDYYGILRESVALGIPAILIEHCHVDEVRDYPYCDSTEKQKEFGYEDAEAIAMFLGLSSESLGVDYSSGPEDPFLREIYGMDTGKTVQSTLQDITSPEICSVERVTEDYEGLQATVQVAAADFDSPLMYYAYSVDGGLTYSPRQPWPGCNTLTGEYQDVFQVALDIPENTIPRIRIKTYNQFELTAESNILEGYSVFRSPQEQPESQEVMGAAVSSEVSDPEALPESQQASAGGWLGGRGDKGQEEEPGYNIGIQDFLLVSLLAAVALLVLMMVLQIIQSATKIRNRHNKRR